MNEQPKLSEAEVDASCGHSGLPETAVQHGEGARPDQSRSGAMATRWTWPTSWIAACRVAGIWSGSKMSQKRQTGFLWSVLTHKTKRRILPTSRSSYDTRAIVQSLPKKQVSCTPSGTLSFRGLLFVPFVRSRGGYCLHVRIRRPSGLPQRRPAPFSAFGRGEASQVPPQLPQPNRPIP